jgi:hypothetical protein
VFRLRRGSDRKIGRPRGLGCRPRRRAQGSAEIEARRQWRPCRRRDDAEVHHCGRGFLDTLHPPGLVLVAVGDSRHTSGSTGRLIRGVEVTATRIRRPAAAISLIQDGFHRSCPLLADSASSYSELKLTLGFLAGWGLGCWQARVLLPEPHEQRSSRGVRVGSPSMSVPVLGGTSLAPPPNQAGGVVKRTDELVVDTEGGHWQSSSCIIRVILNCLVRVNALDEYGYRLGQ